MKKIILIVIGLLLIILLSCGKEQTTQTTQKFDLNKILLDTNWVEITDTVDVTEQIKCLAQPLTQNNGIIFQSENDYKNLWEQSVTDYPEWVINCYGLSVFDSTKVNYQTPDINFIERTVIGVGQTTSPAKFSRFILEISLKGIITSILYSLEYLLNRKPSNHFFVVCV